MLYLHVLQQFSAEWQKHIAQTCPAPSHQTDLHPSSEAQWQFSQCCGRVEGGMFYSDVLGPEILNFPPIYQAIYLVIGVETVTRYFLPQNRGCVFLFL